MTDERTFNEHLNLTLQEIKGNKLPFGGVSIIAAGDFLQLPPVMDKSVFQPPNNVGYVSIPKNLWTKHFMLHELIEVLRQSSDPDFAEILNRVREGEHTDDDVENIEALAETNTSTWPNGFVKVYITNHRSNIDNEQCMSALEETILIINAKDSARDVQTEILSVSLSDLDVHKTGNLLGQLKICVGARVMLTYNMDLEGSLINGSTGTVIRMQMPLHSDPLHGKIYVKFDDPNAGESHKNSRFADEELRQCVPIIATVKTFPYSHKNRTITVQRKQFPLKLAFAITIHNSQGSSLEYMTADFDRTSKTGKVDCVPVNPGAFYTALSRAKSRDKVQMKIFCPDHIKVNTLALDEMKRMRKEKVFSWQHPLREVTGNKMTLSNIRSWNAHIEHFINDSVFSECCDIMCFTETHTNNRSYTRIDEYLNGWKDVHNPLQHGLAVCYKEEGVQIIEEIQLQTVMEVLALLLDLNGGHILLVLLYRAPGPAGTFVDDLIVLIETILNDIHPVDRILLIGDFNLDQMLDENIHTTNPLLQRFHFHQHSHYSTHIQGGILDLVFDTNMGDCVSWIPSPYSVHFAICIDF